jgi:hypothetical protein
MISRNCKQGKNRGECQEKCNEAPKISSPASVHVGILLNKLAAVKADRRLRLDGRAILHIPFSILISLPGAVIHILFFRNINEVSDDWRRFHLEEPLLHFNVTLAPPTKWMGLGIAIQSYIAAVLIIGARTWSNLWPSRKAVLDRELTEHLAASKSKYELYGPGGAASNLLGPPGRRQDPRIRTHGRPPSFPFQVLEGILGSQRGHKP